MVELSIELCMAHDTLNDSQYIILSLSIEYTLGRCAPPPIVTRPVSRSGATESAEAVILASKQRVYLYARRIAHSR